jgi:hypothetical protein
VAALYDWEGDVVIKVSSPKEDSGLTEAELLATLAAVRARAALGDIPPWDGKTSGEELLPAELPPVGAVVAQREYAEADGLGVTEVRFANGLTALLKRTDFLDDDVQVTYASSASDCYHSDSSARRCGCSTPAGPGAASRSSKTRTRSRAGRRARWRMSSATPASLAMGRGVIKCRSLSVREQRYIRS